MSGRAVEGGAEWVAAVEVALAAAGMTWHAMARKLGVAPETVYRWRRTGTVPCARHRAAVSVLLVAPALRQIETTADGRLRWAG